MGFFLVVVTELWNILEQAFLKDFYAIVVGCNFKGVNLNLQALDIEIGTAFQSPENWLISGCFHKRREDILESVFIHMGKKIAKYLMARVFFFSGVVLRQEVLFL